MAKLDKKGEIEVENSNNLFDGDIDKLFAKKLVIVLMEKINVKKIELFFSGGFVENGCKNVVFSEKMLFLHRVAICCKIAIFGN